MKDLAAITQKLLHNGVLDELVAAVLEDALKESFTCLEKLSNKDHIEKHHWQDYVYNLSFAHACIRVLRYFTSDKYYEEESKATRYSNLLGEKF